LATGAAAFQGVGMILAWAVEGNLNGVPGNSVPVAAQSMVSLL
jgi:hypothetical protein